MKENYIKVKGHGGLARDPHTNSIINVNNSEYDEYIKRKSLKSKENEKINILETDLANIKNDIDEIKHLLRSLTNES
mgnify:FL=1|jgi:predicted ribosome quality control (RQC) complex YloA/Tae2 family protein|tara:strand:+ start:8604 stop:8834 length:231 start_codon:yes stop_codon:yes gene_type:complete